MIRQPYQANPMAWDRAQRTSQTPAEIACAIEGPGTKTARPVAIFFGVGVAIIVVAVLAHVVARLV